MRSASSVSPPPPPEKTKEVIPSPVWRKAKVSVETVLSISKLFEEKRRD